MRLAHKPGIDYGIDYGLVAVAFLWIAVTIMLVILLVTKGNAEGAPVRPHSRAANYAAEVVG